MTIMGIAMSQGRQAALVVASGVVAGSMTWAVLAATGLSAILATWANALFVIKIVGGLYLLYLAYRSARSAIVPSRGETQRSPIQASYPALFRRGLLLHLTNPKAILAWIAIMSLGVQPGMPAWIFQAIIGGCAFLGLMVFGGYALAFSTPIMVRGYRKISRWIDASLSAFYGYAGLRLLMSRT